MISASPRKLISWNVNGLRAALRKGFADFLNEASPDVVCLQETRISRKLADQFRFTDFPHTIWNCADKKGYSGTAILSKTAPLSYSLGLGDARHDGEGRVIRAEFEDYHLVNVYTPNAQGHDESGRPKRLDYRTREWDAAFRAYLAELDRSKPVIVCGDFNVAHREIDLANPKTNRRNAGFTDEEREGFGALLATGFVDAFRYLNPDRTGCYTWWTYRAGARKRNVGWRIDYFCLSERLLPSLADCLQLDHIHGSDHCPVELLLR